MIPAWEMFARLLLAVARGDVLVALGEIEGVDEARWEN